MSTCSRKNGVQLCGLSQVGSQSLLGGEAGGDGQCSWVDPRYFRLMESRLLFLEIIQ